MLWFHQRGGIIETIQTLEMKNVSALVVPTPKKTIFYNIKILHTAHLSAWLHIRANFAYNIDKPRYLNHFSEISTFNAMFKCWKCTHSCNAKKVDIFRFFLCFEKINSKNKKLIRKSSCDNLFIPRFIYELKYKLNFFLIQLIYARTAKVLYWNEKKSMIDTVSFMEINN